MIVNRNRLRGLLLALVSSFALAAPGGAGAQPQESVGTAAEVAALVTTIGNGLPSPMIEHYVSQQPTR